MQKNLVNHLLIFYNADNPHNSLGLGTSYEIISKETGKTIEEVKAKKHPLRPVFMDLLYRIRGLTGIGIGKIFEVDYSTVSQTRKRLKLQLEKDHELRKVVERIESNLSI